MTASARATVRVQNPGRYLAQLCDHAEAIGHTPLPNAGGQHGQHMQHMRGHGQRPAAVQRRESAATLVFPDWGSCEVEAADDLLTLTVTGESVDGVGRIQQTIGADLEQFGRRAGITVTWEQAD